MKIFSKRKNLLLKTTICFERVYFKSDCWKKISFFGSFKLCRKLLVFRKCFKVKKELRWLERASKRQWTINIVLVIVFWELIIFNLTLAISICYKYNVCGITVPLFCFCKYECTASLHFPNRTKNNFEGLLSIKKVKKTRDIAKNPFYSTT